MNDVNVPPENPQASQPAGSGKPKSKNTVAKLVLLVLVVGVAMYIGSQREKESQLTGWGEDLDKGLKLAQDKKKSVVVFFTQKTPTTADKNMITNLSTPKTTQALADNPSFVLVHLNNVDNADAFKKFGIDTTPTLVMLDWVGHEEKRRKGIVIDVDIVEGFLGLSKTGASATGPAVH